MTVLKRLLAVALVASASVVTACSDSVGPEDVDPEQLAAGVEALSGVFANNAAFTSLQSLAETFPPLAGAPMRAALAPVDALSQLRRSPHSARLALQTARAAVRSPSGLHAWLPTDLRGRTFVWDVDADEYVINPLVSGAPVNGMRVRLYLIDPATGMPFEVPSLQQIGYVELTDESDNQVNQMGVLVNMLGATVADYAITETPSLSTPHLDALGYFRNADGTRQASFDLSLLDHVQTGLLEMDYRVAGDEGTFINVNAVGNDDGSTIAFEVGRGRNSIALEAVQDDLNNTINGTIAYNGTTVGTITGPADDPDIAGANGHELTNNELFAIGQIFGTSLLFLLVLTIGVFGPAVIVFDV